MKPLAIRMCRRRRDGPDRLGDARRRHDAAGKSARARQAHHPLHDRRQGQDQPLRLTHPQRGLARRASFVDSMKTQYSQILLVDGGGFFPEQDTHRDVAWFLMDAMKHAEHRRGRRGRSGSALRARVPARSGQAQPAAARQREPVREEDQEDRDRSPYLFKKVGTVKVGIFGLISDKARPRARRVIRCWSGSAGGREADGGSELRKKGATVIVLLSQLGKVESEDLVTAVDGIDAVIVGRTPPMLRRAGSSRPRSRATAASRASTWAARSSRSMPARKATGGDNEVFMLGPEVGEKAEIAQIGEGVRGRLQREAAQGREREKRCESRGPRHRQNEPGPVPGLRGLHPLPRQDEAEQWKTTPHARRLADAGGQQQGHHADECVELPRRSASTSRADSRPARTTAAACPASSARTATAWGPSTKPFAATAAEVTGSRVHDVPYKDNDPNWNFSSSSPRSPTSQTCATNSSGRGMRLPAARSHLRTSAPWPPLRRAPRRSPNLRLGPEHAGLCAVSRAASTSAAPSRFRWQAEARDPRAESHRA